MQPPRIPEDEQRRLAALLALEILDTESEERFDRLTRLACRLFDVPIVVVSLVDAQREWFKSHPGLCQREGPRSISFCGHTILGDDTFIIEDARRDPRFADNPMVGGDDGIRFYAGHPLKAPDGSRIGAFCLKDRRPRRLEQQQLAQLRDLAAMVETELHFGQIVQLQRAVRSHEQAHERAEAERQRFFRLSLDMLSISDFDGYFKQLNPAWEETLGYSLDELKRRPFIEHVHPDDRAATEEEAARAYEGNDTVGFENRYRCRNGEYRWLHWNAVSDPQHRLIYAVARDVTSIKTMERQLRQATRRSEEANRAKSEFLANMSHELRTPLNSVIGFSNILLKNRRGNLAPEDLNFLERVRSNGTHLLTLINEVLDISKIEAGKLQLEIAPLQLADVARQTMMQVEAMAREKGLDFMVELPAELQPLLADAHRLKQVLINLVGNAVKFTERGSVTLRVVADGAGVASRIDVADTGIGIQPEQLDHIFQAFRQADNSTTRRFGGTGLGLTISQALCRLMGFDLQVDSAPDRGTTFSVVLSPGPVVETAAAAPAGGVGEDPRPATGDRVLQPAVSRDASGAVAGDLSAGDDDPPPRDGYDDVRVLIVDDEEDSRLLTRAPLQDLGCRVLTASSGAEGIELARRERPHLITLDLMMPGMSGWETLKRLKADPATARIPVVVASLLGRETRGTVTGAVEVLDKPVYRSVLKQLIDRHVRAPSRRVLVVDDHADARELLAEYARDYGADVVEAGDGRQALQRLEEIDADLVLLDVMMPVMDGLAFLERLHELPTHRRPPVVLVSAAELSSDQQRMVDDRVLAVLSKGANLDERLADVLESIFGAPVGG